MDLKVPNDFIAHLLVIDDDDRIRELLERYLSAEGYLVSVAESADDAFAPEQLGLCSIWN